MKHTLAISPLLQSLQLEFSAQQPFGRACDLLTTALPRAQANSSQSQRLMQYLGGQAAVEEALLRPGFSCEAEQPATLYAMVDGGHLLTDRGYRETKVGRVFAGQHLKQTSNTTAGDPPSDGPQVECRMHLEHSDYLAHLGHYGDFTTRFDQLLRAHVGQAPTGSKLVLISDGAEWIARWQQQTYPKAIMILDFYHAVEHLANFASRVFTSAKARTDWIEQQAHSLKQGKLDKVMLAVRTKSFNRRASIREQAAKLLAYYENNRYRMRYDEYLAQGLTIGSGAIESAISTLVQQRCKLVGQRWTADRVAAVLNMRALYQSGKQEHVLQIINQQMGYVQAA